LMVCCRVLWRAVDDKSDKALLIPDWQLLVPPPVPDQEQDCAPGRPGQVRVDGDRTINL